MLSKFPSSQTSRPLSRPTHVSEAWTTSGFVLQVSLNQPRTITMPPGSHLLHASFTSSQGAVYCEKHLFILQGSIRKVVRGDSYSVTHDKKNLFSLYAPRGGCMSVALRNHVSHPFLREKENLISFICIHMCLSYTCSRFPPQDAFVFEVLIPSLKTPSFVMSWLPSQEASKVTFPSSRCPYPL